jgi:hypothetical protein
VTREPLTSSNGDGRAVRTAWILGSSRSGSTWLLRMLADLSGVVAIDETHIGHHLGVWRPISLAWATAEAAPPLTTYREIKRSLPDYVFSDQYRHVWHPALSHFLADRLRGQIEEDPSSGTNPLVVIKEPGGSEVAELLLSLLAGSKLVFLLRDGRDVVDSWLDAYRDGTWAASEGTFALRSDARLAFIRWQASVWAFRTREVQRAYDGLPAERRVLVRYEDLVEQPERELGRVATALGLAASVDSIRDAVARHRYDRVPIDERGSGRRIRWADPGRWRTSMTQEEIVALAEIVDPLLVDYGYGASLARSSVAER